MIDSTVKRIGRNLLCVAALACCASSMANETSTKPAAAPPRYTFSWRVEGDALQPRGGTTKGAPVTLDVEPSEGWEALQVPGISNRERDRRAILAMAGSYRVTFDFLEIVPYIAPAKPNPPYQSWGTEKVYVDTNQDDAVSLVHILEMRIVQQDGTLTEPMVTKHWRQDWTYQPSHIVEYRGRDHWERRKLAASESKGAWSQAVYQVDESPRYASLGRWQHSATVSTWLSGETWRPLPRREWSVRDDYQVLLGTNRHSIGPTGWVQEENNVKTALDAQRAIDAARPYIAREYGVARYERLLDADFVAADRYYERTRGFWDRVRDTWADVFAKQGSVTLRGPVDKLGLFRPLFERADAIEEKGSTSAAEDAVIIHDALRDMGAVK